MSKFNEKIYSMGAIDKKRKIAIETAEKGSLKGIFSNFIGQNWDLEFIVDGGTALEFHRILPKYTSPDIDVDLYTENKRGVIDDLINRLIEFIRGLPADLIESLETTEEERRVRVEIRNIPLKDGKVLVTYADAKDRYKQVAVSLKNKGVQFHILEINIKEKKFTGSHEAVVFGENRTYSIVRFYSLADLIKNNLKTLEHNMAVFTHYRGLFNLTGQDEDDTVRYLIKTMNNIERILLMLKTLRDIPGMSKGKSVTRMTQPATMRSNARLFGYDMRRLNSLYIEEIEKKPDFLNKAKEDFMKIFRENSTNLPFVLLLQSKEKRELLESAIPGIRIRENAGSGSGSGSGSGAGSKSKTRKRR